MSGSRETFHFQAELSGTVMDAAVGPQFEDLPVREPEADKRLAASDPAAHLTSFLPQVAITTTLVAVFPVALVWGLQAMGVLRSALLSIGMVIVLSGGASWIGGRIWRSRSHPGEDLLFSELMIWGWLRRWWIERQLANTHRLLEGLGAAEELSQERRAQLLGRLAATLEA